jgi:DNA polymerase III subunit epsilon
MSSTGLTNALNDLDLAIVDVETTGAASHYHRIIEVAVLRVRQGKLVEKFSTLLDPERTITPFIEGLTGIRNKDLEGAPTFHQVKDRLYDLLNGAIFVAHNARFDYSFLREEFEREKINYSAKRLCTMRLSKALFPDQRKHNLDSIIERFGIICTDRHRAEGDASVLWDFLQILKERFDNNDLRKTLGKILRTPTLPPLLDERLVKSLPETYGVYVLYDENGNPLYVGKSVNIRSRVLSHFSGDQESAKEQALCRQVVDIQAIATSGELGALLLESHLIKRLQPLYNRKSRSHKRLVVMKKSMNEEQYGTIRLEYLRSVRSTDLSNIVGIFKSMKQSKDFLWNIAKGYTLCPRILGLEKGKGECSYTQLQRCNGACNGSEPADAYNRRFNLAFAGRRVMPWPFAGPILIEEKSESGNEGELFVVDNWCLVGCFRFDETGSKRCLLEGGYAFDYDGYKILKDYLLKSRKQVHLKQLTTAEAASILEE